MTKDPNKNKIQSPEFQRKKSSPSFEKISMKRAKKQRFTPTENKMMGIKNFALLPSTAKGGSEPKTASFARSELSS